jgi:signal peptidase I
MNDRAAADPASPTAPGPAPPSESHSEGGVKETIESIIVAFILAFIFRGFVVEAFVIPTGSMAPTLLGAHMRFTCQDCGYKFDVNFPGEGEGDDIRIPSFAHNRVFAAYCPNCGYKIPRTDPADRNNDATAPPVRYGDRILVLKYLYLVNEPQRWDVVVFKAPAEPAKYDYAQNYIKRLVGKPGEAVFILDGDVYVGKPGAPPETFVVQGKPRIVQEALWRIVSDNDYLPRGLDRESGVWRQPWRADSPQSGWDTNGREFVFTNESGAGILEFDAEANPDKRSLTDWLAYDVVRDPRSPHDAYYVPNYTPDGAVSDIKLQFYYDRISGDGPLRLEISKLDKRFVATMTRDHASLSMIDDSSGQTTQIAQDAPLPPNGRSRHVEFTNVDYQVTLRIDGKPVIRTTPQQYHPNMHALLEAANSGAPQPKPHIRITAERQTSKLSHISLWRDVYYINRRDRDNPVRWGSPRNYPHHVIVLDDDQYFVLGDNSIISGDARTWEEGIDLPDEKLHVKPGVVPGRFLIGKAFFVYWPAGYRPFETSPAVVPNFGDMRFIH